MSASEEHQDSFSAEEQQTLLELRKGQAAQEEFFNQHRDQLRRLASSRIPPQLTSRLDASDVIQDAFIAYSSRVSAFLESPRIPPLIWLRRLLRQIVHKKSREHFDAQCRDVRREMQVGDEDGVNMDVLSASLSSVGKSLAQLELQTKIRNLLETMSTVDREILCLVHYEGKTTREASLELGIQYETAKKRYSRALERLRAICVSNFAELSTT